MSVPPSDPQSPPPAQEPPAPAHATKKQTKKWPWIVGLFVALIAIGSISATGGKKDTTPAAAATTSAAAQPTTTVARTTTTTTTTIPPIAPPEEFSGTGDDVLTVTRPGPSVVLFECGGCTRNVVVKSNGAESLLVNTIGAYSGKRLIDIADGSRTTTITVTANAAWKMTVGGLPALAQLAGSAKDPVSGTGDDVITFVGSFSKARITNTGERNFIVRAANLTTNRIGSVVNTIGGYEGTVALPGPSIVEVRSSGDWTITPLP